MSDYVHEWEKLNQLRQLVEEGKVTLRVTDVYPAEGRATRIVGWRLAAQ